ncbi:hypothetical protein AVEN_30701-1 [Araneus ventricosus]|uniref:Uncharacterized protein n=1 Tax=Araneus ventricosus TaxID=182803 RepID=A0A4Y2IYL7_ARAVE|nr:hypothetical protein AVEN_30701-1 [Araneus ventricosus]
MKQIMRPYGNQSHSSRNAVLGPRLLWKGKGSYDCPPERVPGMLYKVQGWRSRSSTANILPFRKFVNLMNPVWTSIVVHISEIRTNCTLEKVNTRLKMFSVCLTAVTEYL